MPSPELRLKLAGWIDGGIEVSAEPILSFGQCLHHVLEPGVSDHQQIDVAVLPQRAAGRGAEHERDHDPLAERSQPLAKPVDEPGGFRKQALQLREDRRVPVSLEVHLPAIHGSPHEPNGRQLLQLALHSTDRGAREPGDLAKVVPLIGVPQQPRKDAPPGAPEQDFDRARLACPHNGNKRTQFENMAQGHLATPDGASLGRGWRVEKVDHLEAQRSGGAVPERLRRCLPGNPAGCGELMRG